MRERLGSCGKSTSFRRGAVSDDGCRSFFSFPLSVACFSGADASVDGSVDDSDDGVTSGDAERFGVVFFFRRGIKWIEQFSVGAATEGKRGVIPDTIRIDADRSR